MKLGPYTLLDGGAERGEALRDVPATRKGEHAFVGHTHRARRPACLWVVQQVLYAVLELSARHGLTAKLEQRQDRVERGELAQSEENEEVALREREARVSCGRGVSKRFAACLRGLHDGVLCTDFPFEVVPTIDLAVRDSFRRATMSGQGQKKPRPANLRNKKVINPHRQLTDKEKHSMRDKATINRLKMYQVACAFASALARASQPLTHVFVDCDRRAERTMIARATSSGVRSCPASPTSASNEFSPTVAGLGTRVWWSSSS
jgi:hypothetical protein